MSLRPGVAIAEDFRMEPHALPMTVAGRLEFVAEMLGGRPILDEDGNPTGELTPHLISKSTARRLLKGIE